MLTRSKAGMLTRSKKVPRTLQVPIYVVLNGSLFDVTLFGVDRSTAVIPIELLPLGSSETLDPPGVRLLLCRGRKIIPSGLPPQI